MSASGHETDMPKYLGDVRCWVNSGKHLLSLSFSGFDPTATLAATRVHALYHMSRLPTPLRNGEEMRSMTHRVFVYGTLKSGLWNHYLLKGCEFFGGAAIHGYAGFAVDHVSLQEWII